MKYSIEQTQRGINYFVSDYLGERFSLDLDEPLQVYGELLSKQDICPLELLEDLAEYFGFQFSEARVLGWLKLDRSSEAPDVKCCGKDLQPSTTKRTGRDLVELFTRCAECPDFSPRNLLGHRCEKAGRFLGIVGLIRSDRRIAPSTPLRHALSTCAYQELTNRLAWVLDIHSLPDRTRSPYRCIDYSVLVALAAAGCAMIMTLNSVADGLNSVIDGWWLFAMVATTVSACALLTSPLADLIKRCLGIKMSADLRTFRDLTNLTLQID